MYSVETSSSEIPVLTGCVKWFNSKVGYGFITLIDPHTQIERDIFVHHSTLNVAAEQYRYLVQGEYVNFHLIKSVDNEAHEFCAGKVSGINGGKLMCETRNEYTQQQQQKDNNTNQQLQRRPTKQLLDSDKPRSKKPYIPRNRDEPNYDTAFEKSEQRGRRSVRETEDEWKSVVNSRRN